MVSDHPFYEGGWKKEGLLSMSKIQLYIQYHTVHWSLPVATRALTLAATVWLITCAAKFTFISTLCSGMLEMTAAEIFIVQHSSRINSARYPNSSCPYHSSVTVEHTVNLEIIHQ
jgi:hypothetical protein